MKKLFTLALLCTTLSSLHAQQWYGAMQIGYPVKNANISPVFSFDLGHVFFDTTYWLRPTIEIGSHTATDMQSNSNIYGHISAGIQLKEFLQLTAGGIYGGNQQKQDRHVYDDTTIILTHGAASDHYLSYQIALRGMVTVLKGFTGSRYGITIIGQCTYAHNVVYGSVGVKFALND
jgi:hypothetical protein